MAGVKLIMTKWQSEKLTAMANCQLKVICIHACTESAFDDLFDGGWRA